MFPHSNETPSTPGEGDAPLEKVARLPRVVRWFLLTGLWIGVSVVFATQISAIGLLPWSSALALSLLDWGPWIVFGPVVLLLARRIPIGPKTWTWAAPVHLALCLAVVGLMETTMSALSLRRDVFLRGTNRTRIVIRSSGGEEHPPLPPPERLAADPLRFAWFRLIDRARISVPVYWMLVAGAHAVAQQRRGIERERRALRAEARLVEARLMALQAQLNPHFLFNTLNAIAELGYDHPETAEEMITSLSELLRAVLATQHRREVPLAEEMSFVERYCAIQKVRFADRLAVRYEVDSEVLNAAVPTLLLQPLVENAIMHGVAPDRRPGTVSVRARADGDRLCLEVADTGGRDKDAMEPIGRPLAFTEGVGLSNTRARLTALYGDMHGFALERAAEGGVAVKIVIPLRRLETAT